MAKSLVLKDIHTLGQADATSILEKITRIEKRTFPSSEAFDFNISLWKKKPNTRVIYGTLSTSTPSDNGASTQVMAYAVYVRMKGTALLHKVCIAEPHRRKGFGKVLMEYVMQRLRKEGCWEIHLWVDGEREAARRLYAGCGFEERESVIDYYGPGRTGIKMVLSLESIGK